MLLVTIGLSCGSLSRLISGPVSEADWLLLHWRGPGVNSYSVAGAFWGRGAAGGFGLNLEVSVGMMAGFGDRMVSFLGTDEIIMHRVGEAEICTWKSFPFALLASNALPMTIPASHSLYANELSQLPPQRVGQPSWRARYAERYKVKETEWGFFVVFCLCLSSLFLKGFLKDDNIF